jgi:uncharacterized membrane protein
MLIRIKQKEILYSGLIITIFFSIIFYLNISLNIWEDEVYSLKSTEGNIASTIHQALNFEGQPPAYFILLNLWRQINSSIVFSRLLSLLLIILSAVLIFKLTKIYVPGLDPNFTILLFLFNPFIMWASTEIRHYAFSTFLSLLILFYFHKAFLADERKKLYKFLYYLIAFISFYTFYYFAFFLFANGVYLLLKKRFKEFIYYCIVMGIILAPLLFLYTIFMNQLALHDQTLYPASSLSDILIEIGKGTQNYLFTMQFLPFNDFGKVLYKLLIMGILAYGIIQLRNKEFRKEILRNNSIVSFVFTVVIIYLMYLAVLKTFPHLYFTERYLIVVYPLLTLLTVLFVWKMLPKKWLKISMLVLILLIFLMSDFITFKIPIKKYDYKGTAEYLKSEIKDSRPILFYRGAIALVFKYYYTGNSKLYPLPDSSCYSTNFLAYIKTENQFDSILHAFKSDKFCMVADEQIYDKYSVDYHRKMMYEYIKKKYVIEKDTNYYGVSKEYYSRITVFKSPAPK